MVIIRFHFHQAHHQNHSIRVATCYLLHPQQGTLHKLVCMLILLYMQATLYGWHTHIPVANYMYSAISSLFTAWFLGI